jgi:tRNA threonylcarbamoyladenosine biosynthesis protein TsaE
MEETIITSNCEEHTYELGVETANRLSPGDTVALFGDLGAGKTEFIKGVCHGLGIEDLVSSPTFTIVNQYGTDDDSRPTVYHIDLYRIESERELDEIGFDEIISDASAIKLIEWSEHCQDRLPAEYLKVRLTQLEEENSRQIEIVRTGARPVANTLS